MTKDSNQNSAADTKSKGSISKKIIILLALSIVAFVAFKYFTSNKKNTPKLSQDLILNSSDEIFEVSDEDKKQDYDLSDLTINDMRERGAEFIYQILLKNQVQIESLKSDINSLRAEILKYKNRDKVGTMILSYVKLRERFFAEESYDKEFGNFEILSIGDLTLKALNDNLKEQLKNLSSPEDLENDFSNLVPELIAIKNHGDGDGVVVKVRRNISKLVTVRRTNQADGNIDSATLKVEKLLENREYVEALAILNSLEEKYQNPLQAFIAKLQNRIVVEKTDAQILEYLEKLN